MKNKTFFGTKVGGSLCPLFCFLFASSARTEPGGIRELQNKKLFGWQIEKLKDWVFYWVMVGAGIFLLIFLVTSTWIGVDVKEQCKIALGKYEGDCVEALAQVLDDEENSLRERNTATWALGQLGDERALETLKKYYTGKIPAREPYDTTLSQYELKKAIKLVEGGFNLTAFIWRYNLPE